MISFSDSPGNRINTTLVYVGIAFSVMLIHSYIEGAGYANYGMDAVRHVLQMPLLWGITALLFVLALSVQFVLYRLLLEQHQGWMRLGLVLAGLGAVGGALYGPIFNGNLDVWGVLVGVYVLAPFGAALLVTPIVIGRWIARGFHLLKTPNES